VRAERHAREPLSVALRRLCSLRFELADGAGSPLEGVQVELTSIDLRADVSEWVEAGRVEASDRGLATDATGVLRLVDLPQGVYRWRVARDAERAREGEVELVVDVELVVGVRL